MARWMVGDVESVVAQSKTFTSERSTPSGPRAVEIDDASSALMRFASGARGTIEMARLAVRRPCDFSVEVNGTQGTLVFDYARLNELRFGSNDDDPALYGMKLVRAEHPSHPYVGNWWPIGQGVGYGSSFVNQVADLMAGWATGSWTPDFAQGAAVQRICDAMELSATEGRWVKVAEISAGQ
jgi:predicted dehydrogenase